jgi:cytochrome c-type biogenesis protein CcsB
VSSQVYLVLTLVFYGVGAVHVLLQALTRRRLLTSWTVGSTLVGFALHTAALSQRWTEAGHFPAVGLHDGALLLAWTIVLLFLLLSMRTRIDALGLFVYPVAFLLVLLVNVTPASGAVDRSGDPILKGLFLPVHGTLAFFGYAALFVACALGVLYLVQERELKARSPRAFYYLIPSLERCDTLSARALDVGFSFLTLAIVTGFLWNHHARGLYWTSTPKEWSALVAWCIYVGVILARWRSGWGGRRAALLGIAAFGAVLFTFVWMNVFETPAVASMKTKRSEASRP